MSCGDFAGSVQDRSHDHRERAGYDVERLFGTVGAKTITSETSSEATIIFPWEAFNSLPEAVLYPLSAHEACTRRPARHRRRHHHRAPRHRCPARTCRPVLERPLHTERLTLRPATAEDADANWKYRRLASVNAS